MASKQSKINYLTYQTFPAQSANSLQTVSNLKYLVKNGIEVNLYFPLREKESSGDIKTLQEFYGFKEYINTFGIKHPYPHGKIKVFQKLWFHVSHLMWSKKLISNYFKNDTDNHFLTRSDWVAYFLAKQGSKVTFECHQTSKVRDFVIKRIGNLQNVKLVFLNEILKNDYGSVRNSIVLHNAADEALFSSNEKKDDNLIIFLGNLNRFKDSRGINEIVSWFQITI